MNTWKDYLAPVSGLRLILGVVLEACALLLATAYFAAFWCCISILVNL